MSMSVRPSGVCFRTSASARRFESVCPSSVRNSNVRCFAMRLTSTHNAGPVERVDVDSLALRIDHALSDAARPIQRGIPPARSIASLECLQGGRWRRPHGIRTHADAGSSCLPSQVVPSNVARRPLRGCLAALPAAGVTDLDAPRTGRFPPDTVRVRVDGVARAAIARGASRHIRTDLWFEQNAREGLSARTAPSCSVVGCVGPRDAADRDVRHSTRQLSR